MFSPIIRIQGNKIVSATKEIIETNVSENDIITIPRG